MPKHIDQQAFRQQLIDRQITTAFFNPQQRQEIGCIIDMLDKMPAADVVEVVRCEKCEHKVLMKNGRVMCNRNARKSKTNNDWYGLTATANNHFCSYGKKKNA